MLGWYFVIYPERLRGKGQSVDDGDRLASWSAGIGGTDWLTALCMAGKAVDIGGNGYPNRYTLAAGTLLAILQSGLPKHIGSQVVGDDYFLPAGWTGDSEILMDQLKSIEPTELLAVEAWDQS